MKNAAKIAEKLFKDLDNDNDIVKSVISQIKNKNIIVSVHAGNTTYEIWKSDKNDYEVIKSTFPNNNSDFRKKLSSKQIRETILDEMISAIKEAFK